MLAAASSLVLILVVALASILFARDDQVAAPTATPGAPTRLPGVGASPSAAPGQGRIVALYHDDTDGVAQEVDGRTVVCDFHIRGTVFDYRAGNEYRLEPLPPVGERRAVGAQHQSNEQGEWRSDVISLPEGDWRLTVAGTIFHPEQSRLVMVRCPGGRTPTPAPVATPTPTPFSAALVTGSVETFPLGSLSGEIAWVIAGSEQRATTARTVHAVPLDGSATRPALRYEAPDEEIGKGARVDSNEIDRQLSPDGRRLLLSVLVGPERRADLVIVDLESGRVDALTATPHLDELYPSWSPDGQRVAFTRGPSGTWGAEIWVMRTDGGDARAIRAGPCCAGTRVYGWTPDSRGVAYDSVGFEDAAYEVRDATTGDVLWNAGRTFRDADWRPGRPAFVGAFYDGPHPTAGEIRVADGVGATPRVIASARIDPQNQQPGAYARPRWHPARDLVLTIQEAVFPVISVLDLQGQTVSQRGSGRPHLAEWTADGERIVYVTPRPQGTGPDNVQVERLEGGVESEPDNSPFEIGTRITDLAVRGY